MGGHAIHAQQHDGIPIQAGDGVSIDDDSFALDAAQSKFGETMK